MRKMIACFLTIVMVAGNAWAATTAPVTVSATVATSARDITATPTSITWDMPAGTITAHRFNSPVITITFYGGNEAGGYKIRSYTQNTTADPNKIGSLVKGSDKLYLKVWSPNFGPGYAGKVNTPPPTINSYFWAGYDFNGDGDKTDWGKNGSLTAGVKYVEATLGFDINGDGDTLDTVEVAPKEGDPGSNPDDFVYDGANAKYWLGESPSYSWMADKPTLASHEVQLSNDLNPLDSGFKVVLAADVEGVPSGTYTAAGTGVMFDIVTK